MYYKKLNYKIIPVGSYCLPRVITTFFHFKPSKKQEELTCPFDFAFFGSLEKINFLIKTKFINFFDNLTYNEEKKEWFNNDFLAVFNHDGNLNKDEFIKCYKNRINNFYKYLQNEKIYVIFADAHASDSNTENINILYNTIYNIRNKKHFTFIVINNNKKTYNILNENIKIINNININIISKKGDWVGELSKMTLAGAKFCHRLIPKLKSIIK